MMSWWRFGSVMACVVVVGLMLGFLVASVVLFTPLGEGDFPARVGFQEAETDVCLCPQVTWTPSGTPTPSSG